MSARHLAVTAKTHFVHDSKSGKGRWSLTFDSFEIVLCCRRCETCDALPLNGSLDSAARAIARFRARHLRCKRPRKK